MKKKIYTAPECLVVEIETVNMMAVSFPVGEDKPENDPEDMSNRRRGEWGSLWND